MAKDLPVLRRLEIALAETSSATEKNKVYGLLSQLSQKIDCEKNSDSFYSSLDPNALSIIDNNNVEVNHEEMNLGRELANYMREQLTMPQKGQKGYGRKMKSLKRKEFKILREYFC